MASYFALTNINSLIHVAKIDVVQLDNPVINYWASPLLMLEATLFGLLIGILFIATNIVAEKLAVEKYSFGKIILFKSLMYLAGFILCTFIVYSIMSQFEIFPKAAVHQALEIGRMRWLITFAFVYLGFHALLLNFVVQTIKKFGMNNLINFITGKYQTPIVEDRIFLFMDLKSSTSYEEKLGNIKYSELIKDCFDDVNQLVDRYQAEIYQYVGDEVVLTWKTEKVITTHEYVDIFYAFKNKLQTRQAHYLKKYGIIPEFKAGLHGGPVTVAEIGNIKRDIAYHGDVLNTASRIQSICNEYNEQLLISGELLQRALFTNGYRYQSIGEIQLKGKLSKIDVCAIKNLN